MAVPNWGPMMGQNVDNPDEYARQNPPPPGGSFQSAAAQPQGASGATLGPVMSQQDQGAAFAHMAANPTLDTYWNDFFAKGPQSQPPEAFNTANQDQARVQQQRVIQDLQTQASGKLTQPLRDQLQKGYSQAQAQQSSVGSTARGQSAGAAQRSVAAGQQGIQRGFAGDAQMLELQQQQAAQAMLAQLLQQQQGQDIGQANAMAQHQLGSSGLEDALKQFYTGSGISTNVNAQQLGAERGRARLGFDLEGKDIDSQFYSRLMGMGAGASGTAANIYNNTGDSGSSNYNYRAVDGQQSIVPEEDK